jgi:hypothetical protein
MKRIYFLYIISYVYINLEMKKHVQIKNVVFFIDAKKIIKYKYFDKIEFYNFILFFIKHYILSIISNIFYMWRFKKL